MRSVLPALTVGFLLAIWVVPLFLRDLAQLPTIQSELTVSSMIPYGLYGVVVAATVICLSLLERFYRIWAKFGFNGRALYLAAAYVAASSVFLILMLTPPFQSRVQYFGGDAEGSFGMGCFPTSVIVIVMSLLAIGLRWVALRLVRLLHGDRAEPTH